MVSLRARLLLPLSMLLLLAAGRAEAGPWPPLATDVAALSQVDLWLKEWHVSADAEAAAQNPRPEIGRLKTRFLDQQVKKRPGETNVRVARGLHHLQRGRVGKAIKDFDHAISKEPKSAAALYHRGLARERQGNWAKARADYEAAAAAAPESAWADAAVANLATLDEASAAQRKVIAKHGMPDDFAIYVAANKAKTKLVVRTEIWTYHRLGREFTFVEGRLFDEQRFKADKAEALVPLVRPYQFLNGMRFADIDRADL